MSRRSGIALLSISLLAAGCGGFRVDRPFLPSPADWPMYGSAPSHVNRGEGSSLTIPPGTLWQWDASAGFGTGSPVIADSVLYVGTLRGELIALDAVTGEKIASRKMGAPVEAAPIVDGRRAYVGVQSQRESMFALDLGAGKPLWQVQAGVVSASPLLFRGKIYVGNEEGELRCLDTANGNTAWKVKFDKPIHSAPAGWDTLVVFGCDDDTVRAVGMSGGAVLWTFACNAPVFGSPAISGGRVFVGARDHRCYALDATRGTLLWSHDAGDRIMGPPSTADSTVYIGALNGSVEALDAGTGTQRWVFKAGGAVNTAPVIAGRVLFFGALDTYCYALDRTSGAVIWKLKIEARVKTSPIVWENRVYVAAEDRNVYCFGTPDSLKRGD